MNHAINLDHLDLKIFSNASLSKQTISIGHRSPDKKFQLEEYDGGATFGIKGSVTESRGENAYQMPTPFLQDIQIHSVREKNEPDLNMDIICTSSDENNEPISLKFSIQDALSPKNNLLTTEKEELFN